MIDFHVYEARKARRLAMVVKKKKDQQSGTPCR
jgi:hypothetical protein